MLSAQWSCPSHLGNSLKPIGKSNFSWGNEIALGTGYITQNYLFNSMILFGLDYSWNKNSIYFEGGFKNWIRKDFTLNLNFHNERFGLREFFFQNKSKIGNITFGLQSLHSNDSYLINERILGINYSKKTDKITFNTFIGTVTKDFARNGIFCDVNYLYDILPFQNRTQIGKSIGQTNFAGFTFEFNPVSNSNDEFSSFSSDPESGKFKIENIGFTGYSEFGQLLSQPHYLTGIFIKTILGKSIFIKPELLYQPVSNNRALIYLVKIEQNYTWNNSHRTILDASYIGLYAIDNNARALSLFTNIFSGAVLRLDSPDLPFFYISLKHSMPSIKTHLKVHFTSQVNFSPQQEIDFELGKRFSNKLIVNGIYGYIKSPLVDKNNNLFRVELRYNY